jgi:MFS transporter, OFA family, oxalate/formate antiporter
MYTAKGVASLLVPLGNVLTHVTGSWHAVYAVGCGMNVVASLLGFFILKPIISARLAIPGKANVAEASYPNGEMRKRRAVGS